RTHSLPRLVELCRQHDDAFSQFEDLAPELTIYAVTGRYPDDGSTPVSPEEARAAVASAQAIYSFVVLHLRESGV
ncbi:MAG TPA: HEPN domain-containing protein, partial [Candidatus Hydrogenedentes bacterium]|nr:HEPN domain-containing protein [Candidatus Hydrogenedentota bacterium]